MVFSAKKTKKQRRTSHLFGPTNRHHHHKHPLSPCPILPFLRPLSPQNHHDRIELGDSSLYVAESSKTAKKRPRTSPFLFWKIRLQALRPLAVPGLRKTRANGANSPSLHRNGRRRSRPGKPLFRSFFHFSRSFLT